MNLKHMGVDFWCRDLFKTDNGTMLVDVDGYLCTITSWGEPIGAIRLKDTGEMVLTPRV